MEEKGYYERSFILAPDDCGASARMTPLAAFRLFQAMAAEHAERIGVGGAAMAARGQFWLTVHCRVDFFHWPALAREVRAVTWPERCGEKDLRCDRSYSLYQGDRLAALGRTQWAVLGPAGRILPMGQTGFPMDFPFAELSGISDAPTRFRDDFAPEDRAGTDTVRSTDIDVGRHMNNVAYVRALLDCFPAKTLADGSIASMELHYAAPCYEGEQLTVYQKREGSLCRMAVKRPDGKHAVLAAVRFREEA